jgi:hypothetical protein
VVVAVPISACVIPAGPQFQDPPGIPDSAPFFVSTNPAIGDQVTSPFFEVTASDPNVGDDLFIRWLADFPASVPDTARTLVNGNENPFPHATDGSPLRAQSSITVSCLFLDARVNPHRIMVIVADQAFADSGDFATVSNNGHGTPATWTWNVTCPPNRQ